MAERIVAGRGGRCPAWPETLEVNDVRGVPWLEGVRLEGIDFSEAGLAGLRLDRCEVISCRFDDAVCEDWGLWGTSVTDCTFRRARLSVSQLGTVAKRPRLAVWARDVETVWRQVDFSEADMHGGHAHARFEDCDFSHAKLRKFDFGHSFLVRCRFAGDVEEVEFASAGWPNGSSPPVETLEEVDFREARLKWVSFRRLNLDRVRLPDDEEHLILHHFPCVLERALAALQDTGDPAWLGLRGLLEWDRKWLGPQQELGVIHLSMLDDAEAAVPFLRRLEAECAAETTARR